MAEGKYCSYEVIVQILSYPYLDISFRNESNYSELTSNWQMWVAFFDVEEKLSFAMATAY